MKCLSLADFPGAGAWNAIRVLPRVWLCHAHGATLGISYCQQMSVTSVSDLSPICLQVSAICGFDLSYPLSNTLAESRLAVCGKAALLGTRHAACGDEAYGAAWWIGFRISVPVSFNPEMLRISLSFSNRLWLLASVDHHEIA